MSPVTPGPSLALFASAFPLRLSLLSLKRNFACVHIFNLQRIFCLRLPENFVGVMFLAHSPKVAFYSLRDQEFCMVGTPLHLPGRGKVPAECPAPVGRAGTGRRSVAVSGPPSSCGHLVSLDFSVHRLSGTFLPGHGHSVPGPRSKGLLGQKPMPPVCRTTSRSVTRTCTDSLFFFCQ